MSNNFALTVRLPHNLNMELKTIAKEVGMTRTNLIRAAIHDFLPCDEINLDFSSEPSVQKDRLVLNINALTYNILETACKKYNQSMNAVITAVSVLALERPHPVGSLLPE